MEAVTTELPKRRRVLRDDVPLTPAQIELRERMEAEAARRKAGRQARQEPTPVMRVSTDSSVGSPSFLYVVVAVEASYSLPYAFS